MASRKIPLSMIRNNNMIPPLLPVDELIKLNQTSSQLYRLLLRSIVKCHKYQAANIHHDQTASSSSIMNHATVQLLNRKDILDPHSILLTKSTSTTKRLCMNQSFLLLQPLLEPKDYGMARTLRSSDSLLWRPTVASSSTTTAHVVPHILHFFIKQQIIRQKNNKKKNLEEEEEQDTTKDRNATNQEEEEGHFYPTLFVSCMDLKIALRQAFWRISSPPPSPPLTKDYSFQSLNKQKIVQLQRQAMDTLNILDEQIQQYLYQTSISCDWNKGIRIIATSKCIGGSSSSSSSSSTNMNNSYNHPTIQPQQGTTREYKHRFAYRIRVEKFQSSFDTSPTTTTNTTTTTMNKNVDDDSTATTTTSSSSNTKTIQLLGRSWFIVGHSSGNDNHPNNNNTILCTRSPKQQYPVLLNTFWNQVQDSIIKENEQLEQDDDEKKKKKINITSSSFKHDDVTIDSNLFQLVKVHAPTTGAVGHLPVLKDGQVFEYMSGCEISSFISKKNQKQTYGNNNSSSSSSSSDGGSMGGCLHFAYVDTNTESGYVGDPMDALQLDSKLKFRILIHPFSLKIE